MILGLDVSVWQDANTTPQKINFQKMAAEGVGFVYIRGAFGVTVDEDFADNWRAAKVTGLLRGVYFFFDYRPGAPSAATQIAFWMQLIRDDPGELPPALDFEQPNSNWPEPPARAVCLDVIWQFDNAVKTTLRLPKSMWPVPPSYGHVLAFDEDGRVLEDLQDPAGRIPETSGATEHEGRLYIQSLHADALGVLERAAPSP